MKNKRFLYFLFATMFFFSFRLCVTPVSIEFIHAFCKCEETSLCAFQFCLFYGRPKWKVVMRKKKKSNTKNKFTLARTLWMRNHFKVNVIHFFYFSLSFSLFSSSYSQLLSFLSSQFWYFCSNRMNFRLIRCRFAFSREMTKRKWNGKKPEAHNDFTYFLHLYWKYFFFFNIIYFFYFLLYSTSISFSILVLSLWNFSVYFYYCQSVHCAQVN